MSAPVHLRVEDLVVDHGGASPTIDHVSLEVDAGRCLAILGESGAGKSTLCRAVLGLWGATSHSGRVLLDGEDLAALDERAWRRVRWRRVALAFQAGDALDPLRAVGDQIAEPMQVHRLGDRRTIRSRVDALLEQVGLPAACADRRPIALSGGQRRAVSIAIALACDPGLVLLDEPTAGMDPFARAHLVGVIRDLRATRQMTMVIVTHDVAFARAVADDAALLYRGWLAEHGPADRVLRAPESPYAFGLLNAAPALGTLRDIRGLRPPGPRRPARSSCPFVDRCPQVVEECTQRRPSPMIPTGEDGARTVACLRGGLVRVLDATGLEKSFERTTKAVDGIALYVRAGEVLGIAGLNGAGKSTLVAMLADQLDPDAGTVRVEGVDRASLQGTARRLARRAVQLVQQDPFAAVSPRLTVAEIVAEPLMVDGASGGAPETLARVRDLLAQLRLPTDDEFLARRAHQVSGGELQRITIARALLADPRVLLLDEPASMLDPSEQAELLRLVKDAQVHHGTAIVLVSHDLAVLGRLADRLLVLADGRVVEEGTADAVLGDPATDLVRALVAATRGEHAYPTTGAPGATDPEETSWNSTAAPC